MKKENSIVLFNQIKVRRHWDDDKEQWYFSIVDVIAVLTDASIPRRYWSDLKAKLKKEGSEVYEKIVQLKMLAPDGKQNLRDNMSNLELVLNMLAEASTTEISKEKKPESFVENISVARQGGHVAGTARKEIEAQTGKSIVSSDDAFALRLENKQR